MKLAIPSFAVAAFVLAVGAPAQAAMIYLDCKDPLERGAMPYTWTIDTVAGTARPVAGNWSGVFGDLTLTDTRIKGDWRSQTGNVILFDLNRVSGALEFMFLDNPLKPSGKAPTTYRLSCAAMDKPRI